MEEKAGNNDVDKCEVSFAPDEIEEDDVGDASSFKNIEFESEEMKTLLRNEYLEDEEYKRIQFDDYHSEKLFPDRILNDQVRNKSCDAIFILNISLRTN